VSQLLVRKVDPALVTLLKERARREGTTAEELHRRILREALMEPADSFRNALLAMPEGDDSEEDLFPRDRSQPRAFEP